MPGGAGRDGDFLMATIPATVGVVSGLCVPLAIATAFGMLIGVDANNWTYALVAFIWAAVTTGPMWFWYLAWRTYHRLRWRSGWSLGLGAAVSVFHLSGLLALLFYSGFLEMLFTF